MEVDDLGYLHPGRESRGFSVIFLQMLTCPTLGRREPSGFGVFHRDIWTKLILSENSVDSIGRE